MDDMTSHHTKYTSPTLTPKVFANMRRVGKGFSGNETPLFDNMLVQPQTQADKDVEMPVDEEQPPPKFAEEGYSFGERTSFLLKQLEIFKFEEESLKSKRKEESHNPQFLKNKKDCSTTKEESLDGSYTAAKELTDNDMTMAEALAELKTSKPKVVTTIPILNSATTVTTTKPKAKGITIQEPSVTQKTTVSFISSSKGKAIMIESEKPVKIKDLSAHDEQVAKDLHDKIQVELEEEASMATLAELYDDVQAQIDADQELAARMTLEEHEKYTVEERARMLAEFIKNRKKQLAVERAEAIRSKPPTKSQLRNLMMTYLKNTGRFTHAQLKHRDFEEIQGLYNKEKELVDTFVPIGYEEDERMIKDLNTKAEEESKEEQLNTFLSIVPNEEEAIDYEVLDKRYQIVDWKSKFYHNDRYGEPHDYYRVFRADGSSRCIKTFTEMVSRFDRMDFLELHSLVMQRFETTTPEGIDLILWG
ncbi:hypothetical protein Tco_0261967 [Tanacetum coccineum]